MPRTEFHSQLAALRDAVLALGRLTTTAVERAIGALQEDDGVAAAAIVAGDAAIDRGHAAIQQLAITTLATQQPIASDLRAITAALAIAGELERIGDYATGTANLILRTVNEPPLQPSDTLFRMARSALAMLRQSLDAYRAEDSASARRIWDEDSTVDGYQRTLYHELLLSMMENPSTLTRATHLLWVTHNLERVADRATNICEQVIFKVEGHRPDFHQLDLQRATPEAPSAQRDAEH